MNNFPPSLRSREFWISTGIFLFTVLWFGIFALVRIDLHHDAVMLKPAIDVAAGKVIFRDTFCQYGALSVWLQALAVKLFGGEIAVIQLLTVLFYGGCAVVCDRVYRRFLTWPFRLLNLVMFWGMAPFYMVPMHPWSSVYALLFMLLNMECLLRFTDNGGRGSLWLAGGFAGLAFLARHPCGLIFLPGAAVLAVMAWRGRCGARAFSDYAAGFAAVLAVFCGCVLIDCVGSALTARLLGIPWIGRAAQRIDRLMNGEADERPAA